LWADLFGVYLNSIVVFLGSFPGLTFWGISNESWQDTFLAADGVCVLDQDTILTKYSRKQGPSIHAGSRRTKSTTPRIKVVNSFTT
jgi:hypothetical protein